MNFYVISVIFSDLHEQCSKGICEKQIVESLHNDSVLLSSLGKCFLRSCLAITTNGYI